MVGLLLVLLAVWQIQAATQEPRPLVLIGHGANPRPLPSSTQGGSLVANAEAALAEAERRGLVAPGRVAILGHSMGSGVALEFGQERIMKRTNWTARVNWRFDSFLSPFDIVSPGAGVGQVVNLPPHRPVGNQPYKANGNAPRFARKGDVIPLCVQEYIPSVLRRQRRALYRIMKGTKKDLRGLVSGNETL